MTKKKINYNPVKESSENYTKLLKRYINGKENLRCIIKKDQNRFYSRISFKDYHNYKIVKIK